MSLPERIASLPVVLRTLELADAEHVAALCGDWEVARMTALIPHPYPPESAASFIAACREQDPNGPACTYAVTRADDGLLVGAIGITSSADAGESLGYWIGRPYWGNGYATAALQALIAIEPVRPLWAHIAEHNIGSQRVVERCGFVLDHTVQEDVLMRVYRLDGSLEDM